MEGVPFSIGILEGDRGQKQVLTPVKIGLNGLPFYNKEAKYGEGEVNVTVSPETNGVERIIKYTENLASKLDFNGAIRVDYIQNKNNVCLLEVNNVPGLYRASNMAVSARASGMEFEDLLVYIAHRADFYKFGQEKKEHTYAL